MIFTICSLFTRSLSPIFTDSSVTEQMEKIKVTGHVDPLQPLTSVPYEIKVEAGILAS